MSDYASFIQRETPRFLEELFEFLRIPSVSAKSTRDDETRHAAEWLRTKLEQAGLAAEVVDTPGHPVVLGEWRGAGDEAPTVLVYGHYDVQPPEPLDLWDSPPFEPEVRNGRIYARGSADDKGQLFMHVKALEAALAGGASLPVNVVVVAEGEEEVGSPNLLPFVEAHRDRLSCDAVVISDSAMYGPGQPSLLTSLRGLTYLEIRVQGASSDLHSGAYGGAVANPANALSRIIASLHDESGAVAIPGFYDDVQTWDEGSREAIAALGFDEAAFCQSVGAPSLSGEAGYSTLERLWIRPTCDVCGLDSGYQGEGAKTVLPSKARAKVSFRLVPDQDSDRIADLVEDHVKRVAPPGVTVEVVRLHGGNPWRAQPAGRMVEAAKRALKASFGRDPVLVGEGGSIPIVADFERVLDAPALLIGFSLPGANLHAPNEWLPLDNFEKGIVALARLYEELST